MHHTKNLRVVVADDEETNLYILMKNMQDNGYAAQGFDNGIKTWEHLQSNPHAVDLVILDKMMYDLNGLEIIRRMKEHPILRCVPIILQSGDSDTEEGIGSGADRYLIKPFRSSDLFAAVQELTSQISGTNVSFG